MIKGILIKILVICLLGKITIIIMIKFFLFLGKLIHFLFDKKELNYVNFSHLNELKIREKVGRQLNQKPIREYHVQDLSYEIESFQVDFGCQPESNREDIDSYELLFFYKTLIIRINFENKDAPPLLQSNLRIESGPQRLNSLYFIGINSLFGWNRDVDSTQDIYGALRHSNSKNYRGNSNYGLPFLFEEKLLFPYLYKKEKTILKFNYPFNYLNHPCPTSLLNEYWTEWELWQGGLASQYLQTYDKWLSRSALTKFLALCQNEKTYYLNQIYQQNIFQNEIYNKKVKVRSIYQIIEISKKEEKDYPNLPSLGFLYNQEIFNFYLDLLECDDEFIYMGREEPFLQFDHKDLKKPYNYDLPSKDIPFIYNYYSYLNAQQKLNYSLSPFHLNMNKLEKKENF